MRLNIPPFLLAVFSTSSGYGLIGIIRLRIANNNLRINVSFRNMIRTIANVQTIFVISNYCTGH